MYPSLVKNPKNLFFLIAGPCVIENETMPFEIAETIYAICNKLEIPFIFKASYRKANRSRKDSFTGIGDIEGLQILSQIREKLNIPVITDIHSVEEAQMAADYVDILQIPAFLCRQTDLLLAAAATGRWINIKKGQFLSPDAMRHAVHKIQDEGNVNV
ncbi:MAG: 3-deoxy-8-phosphooctulonate synthase, partial [Bacteroidales bacterium]